MRLFISGGTLFRGGQMEKADLAVDGGRIADASAPGAGSGFLDASGLLIAPGFVDAHVHLRQPGFDYKETIRTGTAAAAAGGYSAVCAMPNLDPVPDNLEHLQVQREWIRRDARIAVYPYASITKGEQGRELSDMEALAPYVAGFSDDGKGVQSREIMREAMRRAKALDKPIAAHCEDESRLPRGWAVHGGALSRRMGLAGNPSESEWRQVERDLELVRETECPYHVCHVSAAESVSLIRAAKREGLPVTCETAPHYLALHDGDLADYCGRAGIFERAPGRRDIPDGGRFKMNPPIRSAADRQALIEGLLDGTIDCIATDHAPHSAAEKSGGFRDSLNGVVGLETAFPVLYTCLAEPGIVPLEILLRALCIRPREIFSIPGGTLREGETADFTVLDLKRPYTINAETFQSMGRATPFDGWYVSARVVLTVRAGEIAYSSLPEKTGQR